MENPEFIKLLNDELVHIEKRRNTALARGMWAKAIELDAQEKQCKNLKKVVEQDKPPKT